MSGSVTRIVLHGGAGPTPGRDYTVVIDHLHELAERCAVWLANGIAAIDVVERAVEDLEASGLYVAGRGSCPNDEGEYELDASIMDGARHRAGAIAAARNVERPIALARLVMETTPHVMLAGDGAVALARAHHQPIVADPAGWYVLPVGVEPAELTGDGTAHGTVGAVALDDRGRMAAATSTGGLFGKRTGRVGDTPLVGQGTWADTRVAISCTGVGEAFILAGGAYDVAARTSYAGANLDTAAGALLTRVKMLGGDGGLIAVNSRGQVAMPYNSHGMKRAVAGSGLVTQAAVFAD